MKSFKASSQFSPFIKEGKQGLKGEHRLLVQDSAKKKVSTSIDFEAAVHGLYTDHKRWDYFLETSHSPDHMHALEVHKYDEKALFSKKVGTLEILRNTCPAAIKDIATWNAVVKGNLPRKDLISRFTAETKIKICRTVQIKEI